MKAALLNGVLGSIIVLLLGNHYLGIEPAGLVGSILAANVAIVITLLSALRVQRSHFWGRQVSFRKSRMWIFASAVFITVLLGVVPFLRDVRIFGALIAPLVLSSGFGILAFGPIQDQIVRRQQRAERET
jgi:hypothetical protein